MGNAASAPSLESESFHNVVTKYNGRFPVLVSIVEIKNSGGCDISLKCGQLLCLHFCKESKVFEIETSNGGKYLVPIHSSILCSVLYNPSGDETRAKRGRFFRGAAEIMKLTPLPQLLFVEKEDHHPNIVSHSVNEGEILIVNGITTNSKGQRMLVCRDIQTSKIKYLNETCTATFSTRPSCLKMPISSLAKGFNYPVSLMLHSPSSHRCGLDKNVCTLKRSYSTLSVLATVHNIEDGFSARSKRLVEILYNATITVEVVASSDDEREQLKLSQMSVLTTYFPSAIKEVVPDMSTLIDIKTQTELLQSISSQDYKIQMFSKSKRKHLSITGVESHLKDEEMTIDTTIYYDFDHIYEPINPRPLEECLDEYSSFIHEKKKRRSSTSMDMLDLSESGVYVDMTQQYRSLPRKLEAKPHNHLESEYDQTTVQDCSGKGSLSDEYIDMSNVTHEKMSLPRNLDKASQDHYLSEGDQNISHHLQEDTEFSAKILTKYKTIISQYTVEEVQELLDELHMSSYKDAFKKECISGSLLIELDEDVLENELGVTRRLDRIKLMKLIEGRQLI